MAGKLDLEAITQPLYDTVDIAAATLVANYFVAPAGKNRRQTNVFTTGQLAAPKQFLIKAVRAILPEETPLADQVLIYNLGLFRLSIGEKVYVELPLQLVTAGCGLEGEFDSGSVGTGNIFHNGRPDNFNLYILEHHILVPPMQIITCDVQFTAAPAAISATVGLTIFLEGELRREIQ
jgi:hypothetical protein